MKRIELSRLLKVASGPSDATVTDMPERLKTRVLAYWRSGAAEEDWFLPLLLRRALICAGLIMMICVVWSSNEIWSDSENDVAAVNVELRQDVMP